MGQSDLNAILMGKIGLIGYIIMKINKFVKVVICVIIDRKKSKT